MKLLNVIQELDSNKKYFLCK